MLPGTVASFEALFPWRWNILYRSKDDWLIHVLIPTYLGHPICSDNGRISQKPLLKSECYYPLLVAMSVAYSCLKYGVFITTRSYAIYICKQHCESPWPRNITFLTIFLLGGEVVKAAVSVWFDSLRPLNNLLVMRDGSSTVEPVLS